ncbi:unnamed protein product [Orchesella dallaii]|uniref:Odorant receptor n=1 Tax=Orchesella dallaii TaxID=48710 RepID=A0ABP1RJX5_9HEXA
MRLNEALSTPYFLTVVSWDHCSSKWRYEPKTWKSLLHFFITFGINLPTILGICGMRFASNIFHRNIVTQTEPTMLLIAIALMLYVLMIEAILLKHGKIIAEIVNKHAEFERRNFYKNVSVVKNKRTMEMRESYNGSFDWVGLFFLWLAVMAKPSVVLMTFFLVYTNNDPFHFASFGMSQARSNMCHSSFFNCFRYIVQLAIAGFHAQSMITTFICITSQVIIVRNNLRRTFRMGIRISSIILYRQVCVAFKINTEFSRDGTQVILSVIFINIMVFTLVLVKGLVTLPPILFLFVLFMFSATLVYLLIAMKFAPEYYEFSNNGLINWKTEVAFILRATRQAHYVKHMRKVLKSLRHIGIPVGDVGILDTDIKTNYLAKTLEFTINAILVIETPTGL